MDRVNEDGRTLHREGGFEGECEVEEGKLKKSKDVSDCSDSEKWVNFNIQ